MLSFTEENYLKALFHLITSEVGKEEAGTNALAAQLDVKPATVNNMIKKLRDKQLLSYEKYGKITLTEAGSKVAVSVLRKHRLWETFLYEKLDFSWDEVHEVAEQLEHIRSEKLIEKLDKFLDFPEFDPHGDPIPNAAGDLPEVKGRLLADLKPGETCRVLAVKDTSTVFLRYLERLHIGIATPLQLVEQFPYDESMLLKVGEEEVTVSKKLAESLLVRLTGPQRTSAS